MELNLEKIKRGKEFKNFRALCEAVGLPFVKGNGRAVIIEKMNCHFTFKKLEGKQTLVITSVKSSPKIIMKYHGSQHLALSVPLMSQVMDFVGDENNYLQVSNSKLARILGLCNNAYYDPKSINLIKRHNSMDITSQQYRRIYSKFSTINASKQKRLIRNTLTKLQENGIIDYTQSFKKYSYSEEIMKEIREDVSRKSLVSYEIFDLKYASDTPRFGSLSHEEECNYVDFCIETMNNFGCATLKEIIDSGLQSRYNQKVRKWLITECNIYGVYEVYNIAPLRQRAFQYRFSLCQNFATLNNLCYRKSIEYEYKNKDLEILNEKAQSKYDEMCKEFILIKNKNTFNASILQNAIRPSITTGILPNSQYSISKDIKTSLMNKIVKLSNSSEF